MKSLRLGIGVSLIILIILLACSSDKNPVSPRPPDNPVVLDTGGLAQIPGNATDTAVSVLPDIPCHPAPQDKMDDDGFMRTRLSAKLDPETTLGELNAALLSEQAVVTFANPGELDLSLRIPEVATKEEADSVASRLMATGAFLAVFPGFAASVDGQTEIFSAPGTNYTTWEYLTRIKMPAAWNAKGLAERLAEKVTVLVPDKYTSATVHTDIPSQRFLATSGTYESAPLASGHIPGNHGFHVSGILAASLDSDQGTGAHPGNTTLIEVQSLSVGGQMFPEIIDNIRDRLPATGRFIINTSLGWNWSMTARSKLQRAYDAIYWRHIAAPHKGRFLHCTSAGNRGERTDDTRFSHWNSPFTMASHFATVQQMAPIGEFTLVEVTALGVYAQQIYAVTPVAQDAMDNVIIVGSSEYGGAKSASSCAPADVRSIGEEVYNVCAVGENTSGLDDCLLESGTLRAKYSGTSMATPQITGLAAYLWNLKPTLSISEVITTIKNNYRETDSILAGFVDAYQCVTSLDQSLNDSPVRRELLDVAGTGPTPGSNRAFDENDLEVFFDQFHAIQIARDNQTGPFFDNSRNDLNGNGISTIDSLQIDYETQRFDLNVNSPASYSSSVTQTIEDQEIEYNETKLSDLDILCYYAYSSLYSGNLTRRTELCLPCLGTFELQLNIVSELEVDQPEALAVKLIRRTSDGVESNARGVNINVEVTNGSVTLDQGTTDNNGEFTTDITADGTAPQVSIHVEALLNGVLVDSMTITPNVVSASRVRILEHTMTYAYSHWVLQWDATAPSTSWFTCDSILDSSTVALPTAGANQDDFVSQTGPCESDDGATCQVRLDTRHQLFIDAGSDNSSLEYTFTSSANHSALANDTMGDQYGLASAAKRVEVLFEVTGAMMRLELQFGIDVTEFFPIYNPVNGSSHAFGKIDVRITNDDDGVTPPFGTGDWVLAQTGTWQSGVYTHYIPPGKYRCVIKVDDWVSLYNKKNELPHITEAKNDTDVDVLVRFTSLGGNGL